MRYFAYGTNMNPAVLAKKRLAFSDRRAAILDNHVLRFNKRSLRVRLPGEIGFANIVESRGRRVEGVLYEMPDDQLQLLDKLERCPEHYERIEVTVLAGDAEVACHAYRAQPDKVADGLMPSRNYINHILAARDLLSRDYAARLERLRTYTGDCATCHGKEEVLFVKQGEQLFALCAPCLEAKERWSLAYGRDLTVLDTEAVMQHVRRSVQGYPSIAALVDDAIELGLIPPRAGR